MIVVDKWLKSLRLSILDLKIISFRTSQREKSHSPMRSDRGGAIQGGGRTRAPAPRMVVIVVIGTHVWQAGGRGGWVVRGLRTCTKRTCQ